MRRGYLIAIAAVAAAAQLAQPKLAPPSGAATYDLLHDPAVDSEVRAVLRRACADCHTNEAHLPWYAHVSPVSWMVANHINRGRGKLNFSEWPRNSQNVKEDVADSIDKREMPLPSYLWMHPRARLTKEERKAIDRWADGS